MRLLEHAQYRIRTPKAILLVCRSVRIKVSQLYFFVAQKCYALFQGNIYTYAKRIKQLFFESI